MQPITFDINRLGKAKIVVFGDFMVDEYLHGLVSRISPEAPVPVVLVKSITKRLGGAGNVVLNLKALGIQVASLSYFGNDTEGNWVVDRLNECGADTTGILQNNNTITSIKTRITAQNQQLLRYDQETVKEAPAEYVNFLSSRIDGLVQNACAVIISDYGKGTVTKDTARIVITAAKGQGIPVVVDPKGNDYKKYRGASACTPNRKEFQLAVGRDLDSEEDIADAAKNLCADCGIEYILLTRSEKGMSLIDGRTGKKKDYPALAKEVIDVTGAGDTVISVFTACFALGASHDDSCRLANLAASIVVSKFGAATATPMEIKELIEEKSCQHTKILSREEARKKAETLRAQGKRIVFTNGCFDILHAGHAASFSQARSHGDVLFLGLNSDASARRIKGEKRPIITQEDRAALLESIASIDYIVLFDEDTPEELIQVINPDVLIKGKDWEGRPVAGGEFVRKNGGEVCFIDLEKGLSTTNIIQKILTTYGGTR